MHGWLGWEKFPLDAQDFMPVIQRVLAKNPDVVDTSGTGGILGGKNALLIKQLREAGFKGIITMPCAIATPAEFAKAAGKEAVEGIIDTAPYPDSPLIDPPLRDFMYRYEEKYNENAFASPEAYNPAKAFFEFLNGQNTMDTTAWMEGFANYRWTGIWGESRWV